MSLRFSQVARKSGSPSSARNAARSAWSRSGGTPGVVRMERPISPVLAAARSTSRPSSDKASSDKSGRPVHYENVWPDGLCGNLLPFQKLGWTEGRNIRIDSRWARADTEVMQRFAQKLVALERSHSFGSHTHHGYAATTEARVEGLVQRRHLPGATNASNTIPIVFAMVADLVGAPTPTERGRKHLLK